MSDRVRLDLFLVEQGLANSRTHAQEMIDNGQVYLLEGEFKKILKKASYPIFEALKERVFVISGSANRFVSRGGLKLEGALKQVGLNPQGFTVLDIGISTGGFTDCLLQAGVESVLGVDVGHGQVHSSLLSHAKLKVIEGVNARDLSKNSEVLALAPKGGYDMAVMDVSFISISLILPEIYGLLKNQGLLLSLVKPQFEVGVDGISKGGIVKDSSLYKDIELRIKNQCAELGFEVLNYFDSPIQGKDGNNEFFIYAKKS